MYGIEKIFFLKKDANQQTVIEANMNQANQLLVSSCLLNFIAIKKTKIEDIKKEKNAGLFERYKTSSIVNELSFNLYVWKYNNNSNIGISIENK